MTYKTYRLKTCDIQNISSQNVSYDKTYQRQNISATKHIKKLSKFPNSGKSQENLTIQFQSDCNRA